MQPLRKKTDREKVLAEIVAEAARNS